MPIAVPQLQLSLGPITTVESSFGREATHGDRLDGRGKKQINLLSSRSQRNSGLVLFQPLSNACLLSNSSTAKRIAASNFSPCPLSSSLGSAHSPCKRMRPSAAAS